jgi:hypothetical protein
MKITYSELDSSSIAKMVHEDDDLTVTFNNGGIYRYSEVPKEMVDDVTNAVSIGSAFHSIIKMAGFRYERLIG